MKNNPRQLHLQYYNFDDNIKVSVILRYSKALKEWEFTAWKCQHCGSSLKLAATVVKHPITCKQLNTTKKKKTNE
jgi:hypothetical protein